MSNIAIIGGINHDIVIRVPRIPQSGETVHCGQIAHYSGGKGANQAVAAARAGSVVSMIGAVGADNPDHDLLASLDSHGVNTSYVVQIDASTTGTALITVDSKGLNTIAVAEGANHLLEPTGVQAAIAELSPEAVLCQREVPDAAIQAGLEHAPPRALRILNASPADPLSPTILEQVDIMIVNEIEAAQILGKTLAPLAAAAETAKAVERGCVVTLGEAGLAASIDNDALYQPAFTTDVIDTTGAGDAFCGAFASAMLMGKCSVDALFWAQAAGALASTRHGVQPSMPSSEEIQTLADSMNV
jgi:ribokinase